MENVKKFRVTVCDDQGEVIDSVEIELSNTECKVAITTLHHTKSLASSVEEITVPERFFK